MACYDLKIGFKCNNDCRHCVIAGKRSKGSLTKDQVFSLIDSLPPETDSVQVTGGEPSTYDYLPEILKRIKGKGLDVVIQTNGTGFADPEFCAACAPFIDHAHVALHSSIPEIHDFIVQSPGMWGRTVQGIKNLKSYENIQLTTQTVLSRYNILSIYNTFDFIQKNFPGTIMSFTYPHLMGNAWKNRQEVCFRYSDYYLEIQRILAKFHALMFVESIPPCYLHPYKDVIENSLEGDILSREYGRIGVDFSDGFQVKDYNTLNVEDHRKGPLCKECVYNDRCIGVWKEYLDLFKDCLDLYPIKEEVK